MPKTLHLYASDSDLAGAVGSAGFLCELAPDSPSLQNVNHRYGPDEMLGSADEALRVAYSLVSKVLRASPPVEGLALLSTLEEPLLEEFSYIAQAFHLDDWITKQGFFTCRFVSRSAWFGRLREVHAISGSSYELVAEMGRLHNSTLDRAIRKLWTARPTLSEIMRRVAPQWLRLLSAISARARAQKAPRGGAWFYSTAYNCTKIGLEYETYMPHKLNFLVEDPATGGRRLRERSRDYYSLYGWSRASDIPSAGEVRSAGERISVAMAGVALSDSESLLRAVFLKSDPWRRLLRRNLPFILYNSRAIERWSKAVEPELMVVGNAGDERVLLMRESMKNVPVVMLQHGIMHWVYAVADQPVDVFLVRGPFFQRVINHRLRRKSVVLNYLEPACRSQESAREDILFITAPYDILPLFHLEDRRDILRSLLRVSHACRRRLVVRVHPMERIAAYEKEIAGLQAELGLVAAISYSQGPAEDEMLARARVAVLYFSTMFLDCLRHGIPIISFGWHGFPNKGQLAEEGIFNFASDLGHLEALVQNGIEGRLPERSSGIKDFLALSRPEEISKYFREIRNAPRAINNEVPYPTQ